MMSEEYVEKHGSLPSRNIIAMEKEKYKPDKSLFSVMLVWGKTAKKSHSNSYNRTCYTVKNPTSNEEKAAQVNAVWLHVIGKKLITPSSQCPGTSL